VSQIPFNTVASVLNTSTVQKQAATAIDRKNQEVARSQKVQKVQSQRHAEEVEDPADYGLDSIRDEQRKQSGQQPDQDAKRQPAAEVEIAGMEAAPADPPSPDNPSGGLDISA